MAHIRSGGSDGAPPTNKTLLVIAGVLLVDPRHRAAAG